MNYPKPQKFMFKVESIDKVNPRIFRIILSTDNPIESLPGQFMTISINNYVKRSYSVITKPQSNKFELFVDITPNGPGSEFVEALESNSKIEAVFPLGRFVYKPGKSNLYLIATGTGIVPLKSMLDFELDGVKSKREITLIWSTKYMEDLFLHDYFIDLQNKFNNFYYVPTITRQKISTIGFGRVDMVVKSIKIGLDGDFYLCGGNDMIVGMKEVLNKLGIPAENVYFEKFY